MKKRSSISKAEWSEEREQHYKDMATEIAYKNGFTFIKRDFKIYKVTNNIEELFCEEDRPKKIWFQTWTKLKEQIEKDNNDIDFLNYLKNL